MAKVLDKTALCFDDVLLVPKTFNKKSRNEVDISTTICGLRLSIPIISSNMPSVTGADMCIALGNMGGLGILHRMDTPENQFDSLRNARKNTSGLIGASIGIGDSWKEMSTKFIELGADVICIDVAHGDQLEVYSVCEAFRKTFGTFPLIVGNFASSPARLHSENTCLKIGVGGGSACSTRIQTGCGVPTLQSVLDVCAHYEGIADGGIKTSGDIVKSLAAGANAVMLGSLLAGTYEAPGEPIKGKDGKIYKIYRGNASYGSKKNYFGKAEYIEGAETLIEHKGSVEKVIKGLCEGIRSGLSYCGSSNIKELQTKAEFIKITQAGYKESIPHGLL